MVIIVKKKLPVVLQTLFVKMAELDGKYFLCDLSRQIVSQMHAFSYFDDGSVANRTWLMS